MPCYRRAAAEVRPPRCNVQHPVQRLSGAGLAPRMPTAPWTRLSDAATTTRGGLRARVRGAALHLQRARFQRALRAGRAEARLRQRPPRRDRARRPRQPRRQRRDPGPGLRRSASTSTTAGPSCAAPSDRSLVHWLRRLVFRSAWLDQRVKEGELDIAFDVDTHTFGYVQPDRDGEAIELSPEPSWGRVAYVPALTRLARYPRSPPRAPRRSPRRPSPRRAAPGGPCRWRRGRAPGCGRCRRAPASSAMTVVSPPSGSRAVATIVSEPPSTMLRAAASARRASGAGTYSSVSMSTTAWPPRAAIAPAGLDGALDRLALRVGRGAERQLGRPAASGPDLPVLELLGAHAGEHDRALEVLAGRRARPRGGAAPRSCPRAGRRR